MIAGLEFREEDHVYTMKGVRVPSVSQVLVMTGIVDPSVYEGFEYQRDLGIATHRACELDMLGDLDEGSVADAILPRLEAFRAWRRDYEPKASEIERMVYSASGYAGRFDLLVEMHNAKGPVIVDIKTGHPAKWHALQLAAYQQAYHEETGVYAPNRRCLYLYANGTYKLQPYIDVNDRANFQRLVSTLDIRKQYGQEGRAA